VRHVVVNEVELAYDVIGEGPPFVLLHGFTGSSLDWTDVVDDLATQRTIVTLDHRGHGESTNTGDESSYTFSQLTDDFTAFAHEIGLAPFDLLGHSMGGVVAMRYALSHPECVRSLVLMDTAARPTTRNPAFFRTGIDLVRAKGMSALYEVVNPFLGKNERADVRRGRMRTKFEQMDATAFCALGEELLTYDSLLAELPRIDVPTTVIVGEHDTALRDDADELAATIPDAELRVIPAAMHSPQEENREGWLEAVQAHLKR
jgi:3-oxoadipate enol-lactonase/2-succinyl-6-hydroxy-2,4-cyclohexadiene-1-carboxylate synthase